MRVVHKTPPRACPVCARELNVCCCVMGVDAPPAPGDMTVCIYCRSWLVFSDTDDLRLATPDEIQAGALARES